MVIRDSEQTIRVHISEISVLIIENTATSITTALLNELTKQKVKVIFCDEKRNPSSELMSYYGCHDCSLKLRAQLDWQQFSKEMVWTAIVSQKIQMQAENLNFFGLQESELLHKYREEIEFNDQSNREPYTDSNSFLENLINYIKFIQNYTPVKCFILLNIHLYLSNEELELFYRDIINNHIKLLVLENYKFFDRHSFEKIIILDKDLCEIVENN